MNKLSLIKSGDIFDIIKDALLEYEGVFEVETKDLYECYDVECEDIYENDKHYLDVKVFETSTHYPWQPGDVEHNLNNQFRISVECM
jgi:hypothetical protein